MRHPRVGIRGGHGRGRGGGDGGGGDSSAGFGRFGRDAGRAGEERLSAEDPGAAGGFGKRQVAGRRGAGIAPRAGNFVPGAGAQPGGGAWRPRSEGGFLGGEVAGERDPGDSSRDRSDFRSRSGAWGVVAKPDQDGSDVRLSRERPFRHRMGILNGWRRARAAVPSLWNILRLTRSALPNALHNEGIYLD